MISGFLILSYDCNNRCRWCYASPSEFKSEVMDYQKACEILKLMRSLGIRPLGFLGGEPTLYPNLINLTKTAKQLGFKVTLYTNGRKLSDIGLVEKLQQAGLDFVNVSVQTGSRYERQHDRTVNVKGAWKQTKQGIENCRRAALRINVQTVISHTEFQIYREMIEEFHYANLLIYCRVVPPVIPGHEFFNQKVLPNRESKQMYKMIYIYGKSRGIRTYFFSRMPLCWWDENDPVEKEIHADVVSHCHIINGSNLTVDVNGKVLPCAQYINLPTMDLLKHGRVISKQEFQRKFSKGTPAMLRKKLSYLPDQRCRPCSWLGRCTGGCPLVDFEIGPYAPTQQPWAHSSEAR